MKHKIKNLPLVILAIFAIATVLYSCYPNDSKSISDYDMVLTRYDEDANLGALKTFVIADTIVHLKDTTDDNNNIDISRKYDDDIIELIRTNFKDRGYEEITEIDTVNGPIPDMIILVSASAMRQTTVYYWSYYWGYYPGWGYPGWGYPGYGWGYYPGWGYPGGIGTSVVSYVSGTIFIEAFKPTSQWEEDKPPTYWTANCYGLLEGSESSIVNRYKGAINQCFVQSPYLTRQ